MMVEVDGGAGRFLGKDLGELEMFMTLTVVRLTLVCSEHQKSVYIAPSCFEQRAFVILQYSILGTNHLPTETP